MALPDLPHRPRRLRMRRQRLGRRQNELITQNAFLLTLIARRLKHALPVWVELDELVGDGAIGLIAAAMRFDPSRKVPFRPFAIRYIRGAMIDGLRQRARQPTVHFNLDLPLSDPRFQQIDAALDARALLAQVSSPRRRLVIVLRFLDQLSIRHVARQLRITQPRVTQLTNAAIREMRRRIAA